MFQKQEGFTLIEILVVIGIIAVLATIVIIAINPARQFAQARDTQRLSNLNAILNAIGQNVADNKGTFTCAGTSNSLPSSFSAINGTSTNADIYDCIVPTYMPSMVCDPQAGILCDNSATYNSHYFVMRDSTSGRITVSSTVELSGSTPSVTR